MNLHLSQQPAGLIVYDLDLCLAPTDAAIRKVLAEWAVGYYAERGVQMSFEDADRMMMNNFRTYHCSVTGVAVEHGHPPHWVSEIYEQVSHHTAAAFIAMHEPCGELPTLMRNMLEKGYVHAMATASSNTHAIPVLTHIGAAEFIPPALRVDRTKTPGKSKRDKDPLNTVLAALGEFVPDPKWFCEDTCAHFVPAVELGFTTVKIGDRDEQDYSAYVDYRYPTVQDFLRDLRDDKITPRR